MVRRFSSEPLDQAALERILRHAHQAPSAGFSQGYEFLVLEGPDEIEPFWQAMADAPGGERVEPAISAAPLLIVAFANKDAYLDRYAEPDKGWTDRDDARWPVPYWYIDTGFAVLLMLLTAVDEGLGALFFGIFPEAIPIVRTAFVVPDAFVPIGAVAIGHRTADPGEGSGTRRPRRPLETIVHRARW
jgi:nitroreductase